MKARQAADPDDLEPEVFQPATTFVKPNGNNVNLEMEIGEMLKNSIRQTAFVRLLRKKFMQLEAAVSTGA
jgi:flagellar basal body rod protein FlgB